MLLRRAFLIRHGETEWSLSGQHTGTTDIPLTENGRNVARQLEPLLKGATFSLVLTSPLHRAREICELAGPGAQAEVDANLIEWSLWGVRRTDPEADPCEGTRLDALQRRLPWRRKPSQVGARVDQVVARIRSVEGCGAFCARACLQGVCGAMAGLPPRQEVTSFSTRRP